MTPEIDLSTVDIIDDDAVLGVVEGDFPDGPLFSVGLLEDALEDFRERFDSTVANVGFVDVDDEQFQPLVLWPPDGDWGLVVASFTRKGKIETVRLVHREEP